MKRSILFLSLFLVASASIAQTTPTVGPYDFTTPLWVYKTGTGGYGMFGAMRYDQSPSTIATWTSATVLNTRTSIVTTNFTSASITVTTPATITAGTITFEVSNDAGTTWFPVAVARTDAYTTETTYTFTGAIVAQAWQRNVAAFTNIGVRLSTVLTGTGSLVVTLTESSSPETKTVTVGQSTFGNLNGRMSLDNTGRFVCTLTTAATVSTLITGCAAPGVGLFRYVTDVATYGGVATGATAAATLQSGTGGTCATGTIVLHNCQHPATAGCEHNFSQAVRGALNGELCIVDPTVGTKFITVSGFVAP